MRYDFMFRPEPIPWLTESEWEGETSRTAPDYIRWVQSSLNRVMGLRLAVDGIVGPATRSAVRSFQQRKRLAVDGIVGPNTEAALIAAGAPRPPVPAVSATATGGGSPSSISPQCSLAGGTNCHVLYFGLDKDAPTPPVPNRPMSTDQDAHEEKLVEIADRVISSWGWGTQPVTSLLVRGHASLEGPVDYNYKLAVRRAAYVRKALAKQMEELELGSASRIDWQVVSCGEEKPIAGDSDEKQRRVEVCFLPPPRWFETGGTGPDAMQPVRAGNDVQYFIDGGRTFKEMVRVIGTAKSRGHYIYLLGWWFDDDFELIPGDPDSKIFIPPSNANPNVRGLFGHASAKGVQVRAMLWDAYDLNRKRLGPNSPAVDHINRLPNGAAILDNRVLWIGLGSHHQKVLIVKGEEGLIGFCGGIDANRDRIQHIGLTPGAPYHDVHCCIKGPAAHDLLKIFLERWGDHPKHKELDAAKGALLGMSDHPAKQTVPLRPAGKVFVQIGRTYGNGILHIGVLGSYSFRPMGETTARRMILKAIVEAKKFIYIEDQYLVSMEISQALVKALKKIPNLIVIILIPHADATFLGFQTRYRRQNFIAPLRRVGGSRVGVFFLGGAPKCCDPDTPTPKCVPGTGRGTYVHSKMMVVDDEYAIIGSANLNRRSLTHDSEAIAGIYDTSSDSLAKRLRVDLWAKHLGMPTAALADGVASAKYWFAVPPGFAGAAGVCVYQENQGVKPPPPGGPPGGVVTWSYIWDKLWDGIDPDGS